MSLINQVIPGVFNGVSQQAVELRLDTQVEEMVNCYPTIASGTQRRNPLIPLASSILGDDDMFIHTYDRGAGDEQYIIGVWSGNWKVWDETGVEISSGTSDYLTLPVGAVAKENFALTTVGDTTYVVNKTKEVAMSTLLGGAINTTYWSLDCSDYVVEDEDATSTGDGSIGGDIQVTINIDGTDYQDTASVSAGDSPAQFSGEVNTLISSILNTIIDTYSDIDASGTRGVSSPNSHTITLSVDWIDTGDLDDVVTAESLHVYETSPGTWDRQFFYWASRSAGDDGDNSELRYTYYIYKNTVLQTETTQDDTVDVASSLASAVGGVARGSVMMKVAGVGDSWTGADSWGNQASTAWQGTVKKLQDLPNDLGFEGSVMEVTGDENSNFDSFYVQYIDGVYEETVRPNLYNTIDATTMPHILVRGQASDASHKFFFAAIDADEDNPLIDELGSTLNAYAWGTREAGDEDTAPVPSFIGQAINDIFFFKNRLGFLAGDNVIMSEVGEYYNFFPTTVTDVLDSDPIDVAVDSNHAVYLRYAIPFNKELLLFGDKAQFILSGSEVLTPKTVSIQQSTSYEIDKYVRPVGIGPNVYFVTSRGENTTVREYFVVPDTSSNDAADITAHCPTYLPSNLSKVVGASHADMLFAITGVDNIVWVYNFHWSGDSKDQSAWHKWTLPTTVFNIEVLDKRLLIMGDDGTTHTLGYMSLDIPKELTTTTYQDDTTPYTSSITLSEWGVSTTGKGVDNKRGKLQFKDVKFEVDGDYTITIDHKRRATRELTKVVTDKYYTLGNVEDISIVFKNDTDKGFKLTSLNYKGNYVIKSRSV